MIAHRGLVETHPLEHRRSRYEVGAPPRRPKRRRRRAFRSHGEEERRLVCELIAGIICSDDGMSAKERTFLLGVIEKLGLPSNIALAPITEGFAERFQGLPRHLRFLTFQQSVSVVALKSFVAPRKRALLVSMAAELGLTAQFVDARLHKAQGRPKVRRQVLKPPFSF